MKNFFKFGMPALIVLTVWFYTKSGRPLQDKHKKTLTTAITANLKGFDPAQTESNYDACEVAKVYEGLLTYHYLKRPYELVPNLATAMPTISEDGRVYTFTIKEGVKFHDNPCFPEGKGRELVAEDFVYAIKRVADLQVQSPLYSILAGKIKGLDAWRRKSKEKEDIQAVYAEEVAGIKAIDKYTLQFTLTQPWPQFSYILALPFCFVVAKEAVQHYGVAFLNHPVGTGPFTLNQFNPQRNKLVYYKNPTFRNEYYPSEAAEAYQHLLADAGKKLPLIDEIVTHILPEEQPRWLKFQQGQLDVLNITKDNIALEVVKEGTLIPELQAKGVQLFLEPEQSVGYYIFNNSHALFSGNDKLRKAMSLAFDEQRNNKLFYNDTAVLAQSIIPPGLAGYQETYVNPYKGHDLKKARQLLVEAGYPDGKGLPEITLDVTANTNQRQRAEFFRKCMEDINVKIKVIGNTFPELLKKTMQGKTMMHALSWIGDYPDAETFLNLLCKSDQGTGAGFHFSDPAYDALYKQAVAMLPSPERTALYEQLNKMSAECVPAIYTVHPVRLILYQGWVKNFLWLDFSQGTERYLNIDLAQQKHWEKNTRSQAAK